MTAPPSAKPQPKTFSHAIARASLASSAALRGVEKSGTEDPLAAALEKYAITEEKVGEARLAQDASIQAKFLTGWTTTLNTSIKFATRARSSVENARLSLDATKSKKAATGFVSFAPAHAGRDNLGDDHLTEEARAEVEAKEDEFVAQTEEAVSVMKNVRLQFALFDSLANAENRFANYNLGPRYAGATPQPR